MDNLQYAELFLTESREHVSAVNHALLELERDADAPAARRAVGAIFRAVHTIKGMGATMGYAIVAELAHELETVLDRVRRSELAIDADVMDMLFRSADVLEQAVEAAVAGRDGEVVAADLVGDAARPGRRRVDRAAAGERGPSRRRAVPERWCASASRRTRRCAAFARSSSCRRSSKLGEVPAIEPALEPAPGGGFRQRFRAAARHDVERRAEIEATIRRGRRRRRGPGRRRCRRRPRAAPAPSVPMVVPRRGA